MIRPKNTMSLAGRHALEDMVELEMYLLAQPQQAAWPILSRRGSKNVSGARTPHSIAVESSAINELLDQRFIEPTSNRTFVVSKSGLRFYELAIKQRSA
jgi:hypothetical protein